ncbi:hypothetical protein KKA47_02975 [bacterium]|nr:hypothetical protein [bacterium]
MTDPITTIPGIGAYSTPTSLEEAQKQYDHLKALEGELDALMNSEIASNYADDLPEWYMEAKANMEALQYHLLQLELIMAEIPAMPNAEDLNEIEVETLDDYFNEPVMQVEDSDGDKVLCGDALYMGSYQIPDAESQEGQDIIFKITEEMVKLEHVYKDGDIVYVATMQDGSRQAWVLKNPAPNHYLITTAEGLSHGITIDSSQSLRHNSIGQIAGHVNLGTDHDDKLIGSNANDYMVGGLGNDFMAGLNGNDEMFGDSDLGLPANVGGDDTIFGGGGIDSLIAGGGIDTSDKFESWATETVFEGFEESVVHTNAELPPLGSIFNGEGWEIKEVQGKLIISPTANVDKSDMNIYMPDNYSAASLKSEGLHLIINMVGIDKDGNPIELQIKVENYFAAETCNDLNFYGNSLDNLIDAHRAITKGGAINILGGNGEDLILSPMTNTKLAGYNLEGFMSNTELFTEDMIEEMVNNTISTNPDNPNDPEANIINSFYAINVDGSSQNEYFNVGCSGDGTNQVVFSLADGKDIKDVGQIAIKPTKAYSEMYKTRDGDDMVIVLVNPDKESGSTSDHLVIRIEGYFTWKEKPGILVQEQMVLDWFSISTVSGGEGFDTLVGFEDIVNFDDNSADIIEKKFEVTEDDYK